MVILVAGVSRAASAQGTDSGSAAWQSWVLGTQVNIVGQSLLSFRSPYAAPHSLDGAGDHALSHAYGVYLGARLARGLEVYLDFEMVRGQGVSSVTGLAGITNGDVLRQGTVDLGQDPYIARAYLRYTVPLAGANWSLAERGPGQIPVERPDRRIEITAGKLALNDLMDLNRYAGSARGQFMNWGLWQNTAWDFAADTRGYTNGLALAWIEPRWALRLASFQMPTRANGNEFDGHLEDARGDQAELTLSPFEGGTIVRVLGFVNHARMGRYATALGVAPGVMPDVVADDGPGRIKYGYGLNVEQPLADSGETGLFLRLGWNDGQNESFAFTEVDRHASGGLQVAGNHWARSGDRLGVALLAHGLSDIHRRYLAAGGEGFLLGDGRLNYGYETIFEIYYRWQLGERAQISPDVQQVWNPGYNRDRGPATVLGLRVNLRY